jgi:ParB/RepB/Spo0J family partition protein
MNSNNTTQKPNPLLAGFDIDDNKPNETVEKEKSAVPGVAVGAGADIAIPQKQAYIKINPNRCRPWKFHDRDSVWLTEDKIRELAETIAAEGQMEMAIVRKINDDPNFDYEIIVGRRRTEACKYLKIDLNARVTSATDVECAILMRIENKERENVSDLEDCIAYKKMLDAGIFPSAKELCSAMKITEPYFSRMKVAAEIKEYEVIWNLFHPWLVGLTVRSAFRIVTELNSDESVKHEILERAKKITPILDDGSWENLKAYKGLALVNVNKIIELIFPAKPKSAKTKEENIYLATDKGKARVKLSELTDEKKRQIVLTVDNDVILNSDEFKKLLENMISDIRQRLSIEIEP